MTAPGEWRVEVIQLDDHCWFKVTQHGYLVGSVKPPTHAKGGLLRTVEQVQAVMGEAFPHLKESE